MLLLLDEPVESPAAAAVDQDLESVIRSFEEEIYTGPSSAITDTEEADPIEFLLEASDDELGIPPPPCAEEEVCMGNVIDLDQKLGFEEECENELLRFV